MTKDIFLFKNNNNCFIIIINKYHLICLSHKKIFFVCHLGATMNKFLTSILITCCFFIIACNPQIEEHIITIEKEKTDKNPPSSVSKIVSTPGQNSVYLTWQNPKDEDFYATKIVYTPKKDDLENSVVIEGNPNRNSSFVFFGLSNDHNYKFDLIALDKSHNESSVSSINCTPIDNSDHTAPGNISNVNIIVGNSTVILEWTNPSDLDFFGTQISCTPAISENPNQLIIEGKPSETSYATFSNLTNDTEYSFNFICLDKNLNKSDSISYKATPVDNSDITPPGNVTELNAISGIEKVTLYWKDAPDSDIYGYEICFSKKSNGRSLSPLETNNTIVGKGKETYTITNLENEIEYEFIVKSVDINQNKSSGSTIVATPQSQELDLSLSCPNDIDSNVILTNDKAPIEAHFNGPNKIEKLAYRKGVRNVVVNPRAFFEEENTTLIQNIEGDSYIFDVTENGIYDVAVKDTAGRYEWNQIEVKTIDTIPYPEVKNLQAYCDENSVIHVSWDEDTNTSLYNCPLSKIEIIGIYNDNSNYSENFEQIVDAGNKKFDFNIPETLDTQSLVKITLKTIDVFGNISYGKNILQYCSDIIYVTTDNVLDILSKTGSAYIKFTSGTLTYELLNQISSSGLNYYDFSDINYESADLNLYTFGLNNNRIKGMSLPQNIKSVSNMRNCNNLEQIVVPNTLTKFGQYAFYYCPNLTTINIDEGVEEFGEGAFSGTYIGPDLILPSTTKLIESEFYSCKNLKSVEIKGNATITASSMFCACNNLENITISGNINYLSLYYISNINPLNINITGSVASFSLEAPTTDPIEPITLPDGIKSINRMESYTLTKLEIGSTIKSITLNYPGFDNLPNLKEIIIHDTTSNWYYEDSYTGQKTYIGKFTTDPQENAIKLLKTYNGKTFRKETE